eukprot:Gb_07602 [translate_table: standard]
MGTDCFALLRTLSSVSSAWVDHCELSYGPSVGWNTCLSSRSWTITQFVTVMAFGYPTPIEGPFDRTPETEDIKFVVLRTSSLAFWKSIWKPAASSYLSSPSFLIAIFPYQSLEDQVVIRT